MSISQLTPHKTDLERLSDAVKLSAHVTRVLGQNPGLMTLQGTNSYLLQPPSNGHAPLILIDTSSPHTAQQYVDCLMTHLFHLGLESGNRETHFESPYAEKSLERMPEEERDAAKAKLIGLRKEDPLAQELMRTEYGPHGRWAMSAKKERKLPSIEHIILTHRHLDHTGALPLLLTTLKEKGCPPPKIWKFPSPDEATLALNEKDRATMDSALIAALPQGTYHAFSPFQPLHPIMPGLMLSIIDPVYKHLLKHDKDGKPKWNEVPEIARVSVRCLRTPGHTADSVSLVMCEGEKGVFTGDTVLGQGTTVFTDMSAYMMSLKTLLALKPSVLYPAHGPHVPNREASTKHLSDYIIHRQEREDQIVALLQQLSSDPTVIGQKYADLVEKTIADKAAENKYNHEFLSGKPYHPKPAKDAKDAKGAKPKDANVKDKADKDAKARKEKDGKDDKDDKDGKIKDDKAKDDKARDDQDKDDKDKDGQAKDTANERDEKHDGEETDTEPEEDPAEIERKKKEEARAAIAAKFPKTNAIPLSIMCRYLYNSDKDNLIAAASKSIDAHLKKLESEGKVRAVKIKMPAVSEGKIGEDWAETACWELAGDISAEEVLKEPEDAADKGAAQGGTE